eukprot:TRINITY_DN24946_c0_g2_i1.p1 TRINITY_DN24946_c0_g2~~TRINITY_DN24946_c0_g2_i1.p1  ORF type:complete len:971 (-),score=192.44 TRINITY_DN24946_c0_g2_i1:81-2786(-)
MAAAVATKADEDDKLFLERLEQDIQQLQEAQRAPNVHPQEAFRIKKQLGLKRSEKARAERAVRKGRKAQLEVTGGAEAVQAIAESVAASAPALRPVETLAGYVPWSDEPADLPSVDIAERRGLGRQPRPPGVVDGIAPPEGTAARSVAVLLLPEVLRAAGHLAIGRLGLVGKVFWEVALDGSDVVFGDTAWQCACRGITEEYALYCPEPGAGEEFEPRGALGLNDTASKKKLSAKKNYWRNLFFSQLLPSRMKWIPQTDQAEARRLGQMGVQQTETRDFKIQVSIRFKPGETSQSKLLVPLHQKLALLRKGGGSDEAFSKITKHEPPEFLDALMGNLMTDPVRLPSSGKVCDRRVMEEQLRTSGQLDPFDGSSLTLDQLEAQDDLKVRIDTWRNETRSRASNLGEDQKLDEEQVRELIQELGGSLDADVVEMLIEVDRMRAASNRAMRDAAGPRPWRSLEGAQDDADPEAEDDPTEQEDTEGDGAAAVAAAPVRAMPRAAPRDLDVAGIERAEQELGEAPRREGPKVLAVLPPTRAVMYQPGAGIRSFVFGRVFDGESPQDEVYEDGARGCVCSALNGFNACMLVYGQTGSGKTHTMFGQSVACGGNAGAVVSRGSGCVVRAMRELFTGAADLQIAFDVNVTVSAQYIQVYQDKVMCLCTGNPVSLREATPGAPVNLERAEERVLTNLGDASQLLMDGESRKRFAETAMNHHSSRAHTVLAVKIRQQRGDLTISSQLHLVDLAGSERVRKSKAQGSRLTESVGINSSLMVLGKCIAARVEERPHVPYYESKLTLLLRSALGGNSRTTAVICCHREDKHGDETLQSLAFAERCAMVSNSAHGAMAVSNTAALAGVDTALAECAKQMEGLTARGKAHLPAYAKMRAQFDTLTRKRAELARGKK